ncbi:chromosome 6 open reading frame 54, isoform CRA_b, partial [Homo sapiens]|uniref:Isoform 2 of Putative uncharacterized protein KIF25-AS1 n=1 Tax=Homo sapiens TaxID=9606 RepID=Q9Y6Z4-2
MESSRAGCVLWPVLLTALDPGCAVSTTTKDSQSSPGGPGPTVTPSVISLKCHQPVNAAPSSAWQPRRMVPGDVAMSGHRVGALDERGHPNPQTGHCRGGSVSVTWSSVSCCRGRLAAVRVMIARDPSTCHLAKGCSPAWGFLPQARGPAGTRTPQRRCSSHEA